MSNDVCWFNLYVNENCHHCFIKRSSLSYTLLYKMTFNTVEQNFVVDYEDDNDDDYEGDFSIRH